MAPPKDIARSYPKRGLTADVGFRSEPKFCGDGSFEAPGYPTAGPYLNYGMNHTFSAFTHAAWVYIDGDSTYNIYMAAGNSSLGGLVSFGVINGTTNPQLRLYDRKTGLSYIPTQNFPEIRKQWSHIACTINGAGDTIKMYINGVLVTGTPQPTAGNEIEMPTSNGVSYADFQVGSFSYNATGSVLGIGGNLANFGLYDAELTQDQIRQLMRASDYESCSAVATPQVFFELFDSWAESTGNIGATQEVQTPVFTQKRPQLPRGLDLARGAAMARVYTGRAVDFDGSADYLETTLDSGLGSGFSVSLWFLKQATTGSNNYLFSSGSSGGGNFISLSCTSGVNALAVYDLSSFLTSSLRANLNQWHHAVLTVGTGANSYTVYLDGIGESLANTASPNITNADFELGRYSSGSTHYHDGFISDVKVFDQVLTADQVKELYHYPEQVLPTGVSASNLIHRWALSDYNDTGGTGGRYFQDSAGNNALEDKGSASMAFAQPVPCPQLGLQQSATRLLFPGGATTHNAVATTAALGTTASVSCWFQANNISSIGVIWAIGNATGTGFLEAYISGGSLIIFGQTNITVAGVTEGAWTHLVVTTDSGSPPYKVYVNGAEISLSGSDTARNFTNGTFEIGNQDTAATPYVFNGIINDIACWNTELSLSDAQTLYNSGVQGMDVSTVQSSNLKGWWKCDDFTTLKDYSGNGANATVTGTFTAASFPENASGSTIVGDFSMKRKGVSVLNPALVGEQTFLGGSTVGAQIPNDGWFDLDASKGFSVSGFTRFQADNSSTYSSIFSTTKFNTAGKMFTCGNYGGTFQFRFPDSSSTVRYVNFSSQPSDSDWHQYAVTMDFPSNTVKLFIDGALTDTITTYTLSSISDMGDALIGDIRPGGQHILNPVACVKFYQATLSDDEIKQIYNADYRLIRGLNNE